MFSWFERLVAPYPDTPPPQPPAGLLRFIWAATAGMRPLIFGLTLLTAGIGAFEALLFSMLGSVVDWLSAVPAEQLWTKEKANLALLAGILVASPLLIALQAMSKYQGLSSNFPMRLRWNFHRHLLGQSMSFYSDEFAGRVSAKLMQTALAVRDCVLIVTDILVFVTIYFVTMLGVVGSFDLTLLLPFLGWLSCYMAALYFFVPRLGRAAAAQADARSLMTGRITDAYTNISTVKLFSHSQREAQFARSAMQEFLATAYRQMRLISGFEVINHLLSMGLVASTAGATLW
ncbi:MAG TPA: ABC transporter ATP-binding protein, partial [Roseateles sp.]|nr:ABC transporter ATP-binding protein [Roseateles sp.]